MVAFRQQQTNCDAGKIRSCQYMPNCRLGHVRLYITIGYKLLEAKGKLRLPGIRGFICTKLFRDDLSYLIRNDSGIGTIIPIFSFPSILST